MKFKKMSGYVNKEEKIRYNEVEIIDIDLNEEELDYYLLQMISDDKILELMFSGTIRTSEDRIIYIEHFLPDNKVEKGDLKNYISSQQSRYATFYSFLAEGLMGVVFNDILGVESTHALISEELTHEDTHTGVDGALYCSKTKKLIFGEAKFYNELKGGMKSVSETFKKNINNKMNSFKRKLLKNKKSRILIKELVRKEGTIKTEDIIQLDLIFGGFILHTRDKKKYEKEDYDKINLTTSQIKKNIRDDIGNNEKAKYSTLLFHLPIKDKKELIEKIIIMFYEEIGEYE